jgi:formylmethanofuran dehydrogenase subunit E
MSWMPPELAVYPEDESHRCNDCGFMKWAEEFNRDDNYDMVCDDCYKEEEGHEDD